MGVNWTSRRIGGLLLVGWDWVCGRLRVGGGEAGGGGEGVGRVRGVHLVQSVQRGGVGSGTFGIPGGPSSGAGSGDRGEAGNLNCTRQWGKSTVTAAKAIHQAQHEAGSLTLVVSPSARQSGEFVRKAGSVRGETGNPDEGGRG